MQRQMGLVTQCGSPGSLGDHREGETSLGAALLLKHQNCCYEAQLAYVMAVAGWRSSPELSDLSWLERVQG